MAQAVVIFHLNGGKPLTDAERGLADREEEEAEKGTGADEPNRPSTATQTVRSDTTKMPIPEKKDPPDMGRQAGEVRAIGRARKRVSANQLPEVVAGKHMMLEDDVVPRQAQRRSVFTCATLGELYHEMKKEKTM